MNAVYARSIQCDPIGPDLDDVVKFAARDALVNSRHEILRIRAELLRQQRDLLSVLLCGDLLIVLLLTLSHEHEKCISEKIRETFSKNIREFFFEDGFNLF